MKKAILAGLALLLIAVPSFAMKATIQEYTAGKANADSLGTAADVFDAFKIPLDLTKLVFIVMPDTADVLYTCEVSSAAALSDSVWTTAFIDTAVAGGYDQHEVGVPTGASGNTGGVIPNVDYYGLLPGRWVRLTCDNLDATIDAAEIYIRYEKDR